MQAGHGGIRWNSSTNYIQILSDDNSTWVNYREHHPNRYYIFKSGEIDISNGWYKLTTGSVSVDTSNLRLILTCSGGGGSDISVQTNSAINLNGYNYINLEYTTSNTNIGGSHEFYISSSRITGSYSPTGNPLTSVSITAATNMSRTLTLNISAININAYIAFSWSNFVNSLIVSSIYLYN